MNEDKSQTSWLGREFSLELTQDGSPTLRGLTGESMHHSGGAYSESQQIYGAVLRDGMKKLPRISVVSVGLGLGYNEFLTAAEAAQAGLAHEFELTSFEIVDGLREDFRRYCVGESLPLEILKVYEMVESFFVKDFPGRDLKRILSQAYHEKRWILESDIKKPKCCKKFNLVLYDAFSSKTSQDLWSQEFLFQFFEEKVDTPAWFATYACTGVLRRALKEKNFEIEIRPGFQGKRNSTWATRVL